MQFETEVHPCNRHAAAVMGPHAVEWNRAVQIAEDCANCEVK